MKYTYDAKGICAVKIQFDVENNKVYNVSFQGGCDGNHKGITSLVEGMEVNEVIKRLEGITCGYRKSSCPDQLAAGLRKYQLEGNN